MALRDLFARAEPVDADAPLTVAPLAQATLQLKRQFDAHHGGFGGAPKFLPPDITRIAATPLGAQRDRRQTRCRGAARGALHAQKMARGGLYDQLGGGFCRYSVDERWEIPHFEKMLYDNAQLLPLYADAWLATADVSFRRVALETGAWVVREMQSPDGGYYPHSTPIPKATKASSMPGTWTK